MSNAPASIAPHVGGVPSTPSAPPSGMAIASLIVGAVAFFVGWIPVIGLLVGLVAIALGVVALVKRQRKVLAFIGVGLGGLAALSSLIALAVAISLAGASSVSPTQAVPAPSVVEDVAPEIALVILPDLVGLTPDAAREAASELGLVVGFDGELENALVVSMNPAAGSEVGVGSSLILTTQPVVAEPAAPAEPTAPTVTDLDVFRGQANGHLADIDKDLDDLIVTLDEQGFWRLLSNYAEISFNYGQLDALDVPASVSGEWSAALGTLDANLTAMSDAIDADDPTLIRAQIDATRGTVVVLRDIVTRAS